MPKFPAITALPCDPPVVYTAPPNCAYRSGVIMWLLLVKRGFEFPTPAPASVAGRAIQMATPVQWATAVTAGDIIPIPVRGELAPAEPTFRPGTGGVEEVLAYYTVTWTVRVDNPDPHTGSMRAITNGSNEYGAILVFDDSVGLLPLTDDQLDYEQMGFAAYPTTVDQVRMWEIRGKYRTRDAGFFIDVPSTILPAGS